MIRNDYIMRLIDEFTRMVVRALGLVDQRRFQEALEVVRAETGRLIGIDGAMLELLDSKSLRKTLRTPERLLIAARALEESAGMYRQAGEASRATANAVKALDLFAGVLASDPDALDGDAMRRARVIATGLDADGLSWDERVAFAGWAEVVGDYSRAEDLLFDLVNEGLDTERLVNAALAFYDRLQALDDETLEAGGLPRPEAEDGRAHMLSALARGR